MQYKIAPSLLSADFLHLSDAVRDLNEARADYIHYDVMDGKFVPETSFGETILRPVKKTADMPLDVHLMIEEPIRNVESFVRSGADIITVHVEACSDVRETLEKIRSLGVPASISVKPKTPVESIFPYLDIGSMVLIMTVEPGYGGQSFMADMVPKIVSLREEITRRNLPVEIEVDGGINFETVRIAKDAGANIFVSGSTLFKGDLVSNTKRMREILE